MCQWMKVTSILDSDASTWNIHGDFLIFKFNFLMRTRFRILGSKVILKGLKHGQIIVRVY